MGVGVPQWPALRETGEMEVCSEEKRNESQKSKTCVNEREACVTACYKMQVVRVAGVNHPKQQSTKKSKEERVGGVGGDKCQKKK